jgi:hypothetical protein
MELTALFSAMRSHIGCLQAEAMLKVDYQRRGLSQNFERENKALIRRDHHKGYMSPYAPAMGLPPHDG